MGSTKHEKSFVDFDKPYEQNVIGLKGVVGFGVGLLLLILITFGLMAFFINILEADKVLSDGSPNPMRMTDKERLPAEPRLQSAPGFGVESDKGWVNLELREPQAEYWELRKQWKEVWKNGQKDPATGTIVTMPIEKAKEVFLASNAKAKTGEESENKGKQSKMVVSDSSSGRLASEKRR